MADDSMKGHWEAIYGSRGAKEVSWYQDRPKASWELIRSLNIGKDSAIIDVGGGDSLFVDFLLAEGFSRITVLDISEKAIEKARKRLGEKGRSVKWIVSDVTDFTPPERYDLWHDRAVLHFLHGKGKIGSYMEIAKRSLKADGKLVVGAFSEDGPEKCSGLTVERYSETRLGALFKDCFRKIRCVFEDHVTPFRTVQKFIFCSFRLATEGGITTGQ